jgi:Holliday junction DNA helicase RuvA
MIAMLAGVVDQASDDGIVVDVRGVGYLVFASRRTLGKAPARGEPIRLLIETHVREDHIHLYGFADEAEREWFRLLTTVQGVGARIALAILSVLAPEALATAIAAQDKAAITEADGVGPKLGQRIVIELKDKVGGIALGPSEPAPLAAAGEAVSALVNLGYPRSDAHMAVAAAARRLGVEASLDALIRAGLKDLGIKKDQGIKEGAR